MSEVLGETSLNVSCQVCGPKGIKRFQEVIKSKDKKVILEKGMRRGKKMKQLNSIYNSCMQ